MPDKSTQPPSRRQMAFTDLKQVVEDVRSLQTCGYTQCGNWNLGQCCNHLAIAMEMSIDGFPATIPPPISTVSHWMFFNLSWMPSLVGKFRFPTFPSAAQPTPVDDDVGVDRLVAAVGRISDSDAVFRRNPFLGRMTQNEWIAFHAYHANRHLSFLVPAPPDNDSHGSGSISNLDQTPIQSN